MKNEEYYNKLKGFFYKKFDELEVIYTGGGKILFLFNKETRLLEISIYTKSGEVYYAYRFSEKIRKYIPVESADFEIFLKMWVKDKFKITVNGIVGGY